VLAARLRLPVSLVSGPVPLRPGTIFVGPPDRDIEVVGEAEAGSVRVGSASMPSIDRLLASAARIYADQLIGVMLSGTGIDGLAGAQAVKAYGGAVIAQDRGVSEYSGIPPGIVDIVADLAAIGPLLGDLVDGQYALTPSGEATDLRLFLDHVREQSGVDFHAYKRPTVERRLRRRMAAVGATSLAAYRRYVDRHPEELQQLVSAFLIKVTNFFRDPELFSHLRERVLPDLINHARTQGGELRVWSAGCATGEEAYSVAMLVADLLGDELENQPVRIFATDVAPDAVDFARRGVYPVTAIADVPADLVDRYFDRLDGAYEISKSVRALVVFGEHDLGRRAPFPRIDLVLCRNVLIYFTAD
jgi:two-component system CheB/CheR fusion protein